MHDAAQMTETGLLTARDAAKYLAVSTRTLHSLTYPRGPIRPIRVTAWAIRYDRDDLDTYIASRREGR